MGPSPELHKQEPNESETEELDELNDEQRISHLAESGLLTPGQQARFRILNAQERETLLRQAASNNGKLEQMLLSPDPVQVLSGLESARAYMGSAEGRRAMDMMSAIIANRETLSSGLPLDRLTGLLRALDNQDPPKLRRLVSELLSQ
ncbi:MAG: hypothetical protein A3J48_00490 [Candidatus Doudnabacteria bacterium RIFCSPHIGHO2_02_FULL_46_11]|uniref:Uncharacterized protein n=1 Tax=Candidatus Doudnabacteria bacterium RIFCSPHIGHO2_02_FULL_46_11 TaxID=1817832 RepID=A0A1F5P5N5_9BACT|nr:MAG: hypothetical protein A3J48_00490 [Candidatus Doudnabacteria bacterium RIFCSPHIGHO2_02_FULL_46_11]